MRTFLKFSGLALFVLTLSGCSWRDDIRAWLGEKTDAVVEEAKEQAKDEFKKQMNSAIDDVKKSASDLANEKTEQAKQAVKDLTAEQLNKAREEGQKKVAESLEKAAAVIKPTVKPTAATGTFSYLNYTPETLAQAGATTTFLFFYDENDATARAVDKYLTVTLDPVKTDLNVLRIDATRDKSLRQKYSPKASDELIQVDETGKEIRRVRGEAYSETPLLAKLDGN